MMPYSQIEIRNWLLSKTLFDAKKISKQSGIEKEKLSSFISGKTILTLEEESGLADLISNYGFVPKVSI